MYRCRVNSVMSQMLSIADSGWWSRPGQVAVRRVSEKGKVGSQWWRAASLCVGVRVLVFGRKCGMSGTVFRRRQGETVDGLKWDGLGTTVPPGRACEACGRADGCGDLTTGARPSEEGMGTTLSGW